MLKVVGDGQTVIGAVPAVQVHVTVTLVLFHPAGLAAGLATPVIVGGWGPIFNVTLALPCCRLRQ